MTDCKQRLRRLLDSARDLYQILTPTGKLSYVNPAWCNALGYSALEVAGRTFVDLLHPDSRDRYCSVLNEMKGDRQDRDLELTLLTQSGDRLTLQGRLSYHPKGKKSFEIWGLWHNIQEATASLSASKTSQIPVETSNYSPEARLMGQNYILDLIARGTALIEVLEELARFIEQQSSEMLCSFQLLDEEGIALHRSAAPSLPEAFQKAVDRTPVGPLTCSCGAAAYYQKRVISPDIASDPIWTAYRELALSHGLRACWSTPIMSSYGKVLGTFAMYYRQPRIPTKDELHLIELSTHLASIAIERQQSETALKASEERLRLALNASEMGIWDCNLCTGEVTWSDNLERLYGLNPGTFDGSDRAFLSLVHPDDRQFVFQASRQAIRQRGSYDIEFRVVRPDQQIRWIASKGQVIYSDSGKPVRMAGVNLDITDRKVIEESLRKTTEAQGAEIQTYSNELTDVVQQLQREIEHRKEVEAALRESEEKYRSVVAALQEGIVLQDTDGRISACNVSAERILGLSVDQIFGRTSFDPSWRTIHEDGSPFPGDTHPAIITLLTGKPCSDVVMGVHKPNGTLTWISINSQPLFRQGESRPYAVVTSFSDITARKQAETALRNSEALYRAIVEDQVELVCRFLPDGTLTFVNDAYCRVLGISREDLLGDRYKMFLLALDRETTVPLMASTDVNNPVSWLEHQVILPNGDICWQQWNSRAIFDEQGNFIEFQAVGRDITERKRMENALRQTTERLNGILRSLDDVVWSITSDLSTVFYVSPAAETLYGHPQNTFYENPQLWLEVIHPQDKPHIAAMFSDISTSLGLQAEYRIIRPDGAVRWVYDRTWLIRDEHSQANRIDRIVSDITERKQAEAELRLREARYALAVRAGQVGVWDWNLETGDLYMDSNLKEMLGFEDQEIPNYLDSWRQLVHPDDFETVMTVANKHLEGTLPGYQIEHRMLRKDGSIRWFLARGVGFQDKEGRPYRLMGTNTDITDRKLAEEELRRQHLRSQLLAEVTLRIRQSLRLEEILHTTVTEIQKLLQADRILIYRIAANAPGVVVEEAVVPGYQITLGQNISDPCFTVDYMEQYRQGRISAIANVEDGDLQPCHAEFLKQFDVKANLVVPILVGRQEAGARSQKSGVRSQEAEVRRQEAGGRSQKQRQLEVKGGDAAYLLEAVGAESSPVESAPVESASVEANPLESAIAPIPSSARPKSQALNPQPSLWGLLIAHQCSQPRQWSDFEVELLKQLADQVAIALAQSQLLESLQESEERFYGAFEYAAIGMALVGLDGRWLQVNPALCQIVGYSEAELLTTTLRSLTHPDDVDSDVEHVQKILAGEIRFYQIEKRYIHQQGQPVWVLLSISLVRDVQGQPLYFVTQIQDITKRKQAEEEILKALEKEKELNELKSRFVSMISHEFRTPLTTIQSASELLEHYEWTAKQKQERFQQIHVAVQHMAQLLEDVLLIGKAEAGKLKIHPEPVDLVNFCQTLMADLQFTTSGNYKFMFISSAVQPAAWIDPKLLRQILNNLLLNAIKYSPDGGNIVLELIYRNNSVTFRVQDEGIGIPPNDRERLFEAFYRATNVDTIQGTGLGLAIVKKCVDLYKGQIALESEIGVGTTFTVTLPLSHPD